MPDGKMFCILLIDGLSVKEELVTNLIATATEGIPLIGGSSGDNMNFNTTEIILNNSIANHGATLSFITSTHPFEVFKHQHFTGSDKKFVVTEANSETRKVLEIDGLPAADAYADIIGCRVENLNTDIFSRNPFMFQVGNQYYIRSIQSVNPDKSLTMYCAIENGVVLSIGKQTPIVETSRDFLSKISKGLNGIEAIITFECILRKIEISNLAETKIKEMCSLYGTHHMSGFYTYGEQFGGIHMNQTITGVAFGKK